MVALQSARAWLIYNVLAVVDVWCVEPLCWQTRVTEDLTVRVGVLVFVSVSERVHECVRV